MKNSMIISLFFLTQFVYCQKKCNEFISLEDSVLYIGMNGEEKCNENFQHILKYSDSLNISKIKDIVLILDYRYTPIVYKNFIEDVENIKDWPKQKNKILNPINQKNIPFEENNRSKKYFLRMFKKTNIYIQLEKYFKEKGFKINEIEPDILSLIELKELKKEEIFSNSKLTKELYPNIVQLNIKLVNGNGSN